MISQNTATTYSPENFIFNKASIRGVKPSAMPVTVAIIGALGVVPTPSYPVIEEVVYNVEATDQVCSNASAYSLGKSFSVNHELLSNLNYLSQIKDYPDNWDGYGAHRFTEKQIDGFRNVLCNLRKQPNIAPTSSNSLFLQYDSSDKSQLAFELFESHIDCFYIPQSDFKKAELYSYSVITQDIFKQINRRIELFYE